MVAPTTFEKIWNVVVCPFMFFCKLISDVCWQCQQNNKLVYKSANLPDEQKQKRCRKQQEHLTNLAMERTFYRDLVKESKESAEGEGVRLGPNNP